MEVEYIKSLKQAKNVTVKELSNLTGYPESTINNVLTRKTEKPSFEMISKLVFVLGGSLDALAGAKESQKTGGEDVTAFIATLTDMYEKQIERLQKDKFYLFSLLAIVLVIVFAVLAIDVIDGNVGWIRH